MKILVLGGNQVFGANLSAGKSYVGQLIRRLEADGHPVVIDQYGPLLLEEAGVLLSRLRLYQYDVILLQLGDAELRHRPDQRPDLPPAQQWATVPADLITPREQQRFAREPRSLSWVSRQLGHLNLWLRGTQTARMQVLRHQLATVLMMVQPYRRQTLLLSPLPQRRPSLLQRLAGQLFLNEAHLWEITGLDTGALLDQRDLLFQTNTPDALNALAHELLGSTLHAILTEQGQVPASQLPRWRRPPARN